MKLKQKMLLNILGAVSVMIIVMVVIIGLQTRFGMMEIGYDYVKAESEKISSHVEAELNIAMDTAKALAVGLGGMRETGELDREAVNAMLRKTLEQHPQFYSVWSAWEPNAFDGKDEMYRLTEGTDETGRYISGWFRNGDQMNLLALQN